MYPNDGAPDAVFQPSQLRHESDGMTTDRHSPHARMGSAGFHSRAVGLAIVSEDGAWVAVNEFMCLALGVCEDQLVGRQARDFIVPQTGLRSSLTTHQDEDLDGCVENGYIPLRVQVRLDAGALRGLQGTCEEVDASDGGGYFVTLMDVAPAPVAAHSECNQSHAAQTTLAVVAHELRNPLTTVLLSADLLQTGDQRIASDRAVERITTSAEQALQITEDLVEISRWSQGSDLDLVQEDTDLHGLVAQLIEGYVLSHPERVITVHQVGNLWGFWDASRLVQAISNLLNNAITHTTPEDGPIEVHLYGTQNNVTIEVSNGGDAIPKRDLVNLFKPLFTTKARHFNQHLGLGCFIVKKIIEAHGGDVSVTSSPATGTSFFINLPRLGSAVVP